MQWYGKVEKLDWRTCIKQNVALILCTHRNSALFFASFFLPFFLLFRFTPFSFFLFFLFLFPISVFFSSVPFSHLSSPFFPAYLVYFSNKSQNTTAFLSTSIASKYWTIQLKHWSDSNQTNDRFKINCPIKTPRNSRT